MANYNSTVSVVYRYNLLHLCSTPSSLQQQQLSRQSSQYLQQNFEIQQPGSQLASHFQGVGIHSTLLQGIDQSSSQRQDDGISSIEASTIQSYGTSNSSIGHFSFSGPSYDSLRPSLHSQGSCSSSNCLKKTNLPRFSGKDCVHYWLHQCEYFFYVDNIPDLHKVKLAYFALDGKALSWHHRTFIENKAKDETPLDWEKYVKAITKRFGTSYGEKLFESDPISYRMNQDSQAAYKLKDVVNKKLFEFLNFHSGNGILAKYVVVLVCCGNNQNETRDDLKEFLGDSSAKFVAWLWDHIAKENYTTVSFSTSSLPTPTEAQGSNLLVLPIPSVALRSIIPPLLPTPLMAQTIHAGNLKKALDLHAEMELQGVNKNIFIWSYILDLLCKLGRNSDALEQFQILKASGAYIDEVLYGIAINAHCKMNNMGGAMELFQEVKARVLIPDKILYTTLICGYCDLDEVYNAQKIFFEMMENNVVPDLVTYNALGGGFCRNGFVKEAFGLLDSMKNVDLEHDMNYYTQVNQFVTPLMGPVFDIPVKIGNWGSDFLYGIENAMVDTKDLYGLNQILIIKNFVACNIIFKFKSGLYILAAAQGNLDQEPELLYKFYEGNFTFMFKPQGFRDKFSDTFGLQEYNVDFEEVFKVLEKIILIVWNWYYKDNGASFKVEVFKPLMSQWPQFSLHPGKWIQDWKIAWLRVDSQHFFLWKSWMKCEGSKSVRINGAWN